MMFRNINCNTCNNDRYKIVPSSWDDDVPMRVECTDCKVNDMVLSQMAMQMSELLAKASREKLAWILSEALISKHCNDEQVLQYIEGLLHTKNNAELVTFAEVYLS